MNYTNHFKWLRIPVKQQKNVDFDVDAFLTAQPF